MAPSELQVRHTEAGEVELAVYRVERGYRVVAPGVATFDLDEVGAAVATIPDGASAGDIKAFAHYRIAPLVGQLRGAPALHGGGVVIDGAAVAFLGDSGAGKSTLVTSLGRHYPILGDDCVRLEVSPSGVVAHPVDPRVRLWEDSKASLAPDEACSYFHGKAELRIRFASGPAPLRAIYLPEMTGTEVAIERLKKRDALVSLASHGYRLDPKSRDLLEREVSFFEAIVARVPVSKLRYPRDYARLDEVREAIVRELAAEHG